MEKNKIPVIQAKEEDFSTPDGFWTFLEALENQNYHKSHGLVFVRPPDSVLNGCKLENISTSLKFSKLLRQRPKQISEGIYNSNRRTGKNDPLHRIKSYTFEDWSQTSHGKGVIKEPQDFWQYFNHISNNLTDKKDYVLYPSGIEATFTSEGKQKFQHL